MKILVSIMLALLSIGFLASCGSRMSTAIGGPAGGNTGAPSKKWNDQKVNPVLCTGPSVSSIAGRWLVEQYSGGITRDTNLLIQDNATTASVTCTQGNLSQSATATVSSTFDSAGLTFLTSDDKKSGDPRKLLCEAQLNQGFTNYKIVGRCLTININGPHQFRFIGN
jgi:hypothetical protein